MRTLLILLLMTIGADAQRLTVVELYTSQGCSSCPPADALLTELARTDPDLLALDLHVTYWDRLGWKDPFSLPAITQRQQQFAARRGLDGVYTPQLIVDGRFEAIGSDRTAVQDAIRQARKIAQVVTLPVVTLPVVTLPVVTLPVVTLTLTPAPNGLHIHAGPGAAKGTLLLAGFDRQHTTPVRGRANGGRLLPEGKVVRSLAPLAAWNGAAIDTDLPRPDGERFAVLLQADDGRISGAATTP